MEPSLATLAEQVLTPLQEVTLLSSLKRATRLFSQGEAAESVYFVKTGLLKLTRANQEGDRIILAVSGPNQVIGIEGMINDSAVYYTDAEALTPCTVVRVPREVLKRAAAEQPQLSSALLLTIIDQKHKLAEKVELLCLHDVEHRILHYLAELAELVAPEDDGGGHQLPITQLEFADLIGATRETTSTTLNQLERRGLIKLSRRLLTIESPAQLRAAASANGASATEAGIMASK